MCYFGMVMALTFCTKSLQKTLKTWTSLLVMLSNSKMPACLGLQDLLRSANVMMLNPKGHPHRKRGLSGMNSDGLLPMEILMVQADSMVAP
jgi:hypothetical protein